ncbi:hypothetical protein [Promicromonospora sp. NPDC019610]|uniref:hypothetical protein n=1 Tax=Promicromonospora sp. NPDC019610 TaxID=3364405 RepID=UPI003797F53F
MSETSVRRTRDIDIASLRLDPKNPRLPSGLRSEELSQHEIALHINRAYDPLAIAESISRHRFFESEPLIAVQDGDTFTVVEGNRRLTALLGLADRDLREKFAEENSGWKRIDASSAPTSVPVLVIDDPAEVAPLLGFRHISGIEPWEPYAQARFIFEMVETGLTLNEVADLVGRKPTEVKSKYRDYDILRQADQQFGIPTQRARDAFGVFNNAMGRRSIRDFISAPDPRSVDPEYWPLPETGGKNLGTLLTLIFGRSKGEGRVITDSRQLGDLAKVLSDQTEGALKVLLATGDLAEALDEVSEPEEQFSRAVDQSLKALRKAAAIQPERLSEAARERLQEAQEIIHALVALESSDGGGE